MRRLPLPFLAVAALLGGGVVAGQLTAPDAAPAAVAAGRTAPVTGAGVVCPDVRGAPGAVRSFVSAGSPVTDPAVPGTVTSSVLGSSAPPTVLPVPGSGVVVAGVGPAVADGAVVVEARGGPAAGLEVETVASAGTGPEQGLTGLRCGAPAPEAWFLGGSVRIGSSSTLVLVNPDDTPALLDATVWSATGPVDPRAGSGLAVPARGRVLVPVDTLAPGRDVLAVHLSAERGRFAAAMRTVRTAGRTPAGAEHVPPSGPPARQVVVPGVPGGPGGRRLLLANPGGDAATVSVQLTSGDGQFVPTGLDAVPVPAGTTVGVDLTALVAAGPVAVRVTADEPVLAAAEVTDTSGTPQSELAYAGAAGPLDGPALVTDVLVARPTAVNLLLSALEGAGRVVVSTVPLAGATGPPPARRTVDVPGGRTVTLPLAALLPRGTVAGRFAVSVTPVEGSGPVWAVRSLRAQGRTAPLTTLLPLSSGPREVSGPQVARDPAVGDPAVG